MNTYNSSKYYSILKKYEGAIIRWKGQYNLLEYFKVKEVNTYQTMLTFMNGITTFEFYENNSFLDKFVKGLEDESIKIITQEEWDWELIK